MHVIDKTINSEIHDLYEMINAEVQAIYIDCLKYKLFGLDKSEAISEAFDDLERKMAKLKSNLEYEYMKDGK